ncbi:MAG: hypothetical protein Kow0063_20780 [Anaerolineae bacterium]
MSEPVEQKIPPKPQVPDKCADCPYLDKEHDPFSGVTRLYCQSPWWHPKHWLCTPPPEVARA